MSLREKIDYILRVLDEADKYYTKWRILSAGQEKKDYWYVRSREVWEARRILEEIKQGL